VIGRLPGKYFGLSIAVERFGRFQRPQVAPPGNRPVTSLSFLEGGTPTSGLGGAAPLRLHPSNARSRVSPRPPAAVATISFPETSILRPIT
jgi:hypothetical protein